MASIERFCHSRLSPLRWIVSLGKGKNKEILMDRAGYRMDTFFFFFSTEPLSADFRLELDRTTRFISRFSVHFRRRMTSTIENINWKQSCLLF